MRAGALQLKDLERAATGLSGGQGQALGSALGPVLREVCRGKLGEIAWFRSTWQRGGAATGFSTWSFDAGGASDPASAERTAEVMVKLPVGPGEQFWTMCLGAVEPEDWGGDRAISLATPRVVAAGEALGGYDFSWLVMERFRGHPLISGLNRESLIELIIATAEFQRRARGVRAVGDPPAMQDWPRMLNQSREAIDGGGFDDEERWLAVLGRAERGLGGLLDRWRSRPIESWCHGDVHPGNAMWRRCADGSSRCVLIDLALVHAGHWIEDGVYLERQFWGYEDKLGGVDPVEAMARARSAAGLPLGAEYRELADLRRVLTAIAAPGLLGREGNERYIGRALALLEERLPAAL